MKVPWCSLNSPSSSINFIEANDLESLKSKLLNDLQTLQPTKVKTTILIGFIPKKLDKFIHFSLSICISNGQAGAVAFWCSLGTRKVQNLGDVQGRIGATRRVIDNVDGIERSQYGDPRMLMTLMDTFARLWLKRTSRKKNIQELQQLKTSIWSSTWIPTRRLLGRSQKLH